MEQGEAGSGKPGGPDRFGNVLRTIGRVLRRENTRATGSTQEAPPDNREYGAMKDCLHKAVERVVMAGVSPTPVEKEGAINALFQPPTVNFLAKIGIDVERGDNGVTLTKAEILCLFMCYTF